MLGTLQTVYSYKRIVCAPKIEFISLPINLKMCFGCSKEPSHWDGSFEYPQHMFWLWKKKRNFFLYTFWGPVYCDFLSIVRISDIVAVYKGQNTCIAVYKDQNTCIAVYKGQNTCIAVYKDQNTCIAVYKDQNTCIAVYKGQNTCIAVYKGQNTCIVWVDVLPPRKQSFFQSNQDISWIKQGLSF